MAVLLLLFAACFVLGGASRVDVFSLILLQPLAVVCAVGLLLLPGPIEWSRIRVPFLLLAALAATIAAQLVPLPPAIWTNLPGHAAFAQTATIAGIEQPWRPISLTPDLTLASLVGLVVPLAVLIGIGSLGVEHKRSVLAVLILGTMLSAMFGLAQIAGGERSPFYLYQISNFGSAVGLFSNRNHQAVLIAMTWPMLAVWSAMPQDDKRRGVVRFWVAVSVGIFLMPLILVTGSRAGILLGAFGLACAFQIGRTRRNKTSFVHGKWKRRSQIVVAISGVAVLLIAVFLSRDEAIRRLVDGGSEETRVANTPTLLHIAADFFPIGSGFGSFDPVFRFYEPLRLLKPEYLNHAHNDLLELLITGGLFGAIILLAFLGWYVARAFKIWRRPSQAGDFEKLGSVMMLIVLLSSLVDYPLRTPLMSAVFAVACCWLVEQSAVRRSGRRGRGERALPPLAL
uniref:O-antigen ligase family protein n=1 Tax=Altererythrobacter segetis TaxID=1104773 RepID=UPI00140C019C|nr:O-antigen ligase family protein [Altererythrobacter segetis]